MNGWQQSFRAFRWRLTDWLAAQKIAFLVFSSEGMADESKLLHALAAIARVATSLYGPGKARKQITGSNASEAGVYSSLWDAD